MSLLVVPGVAAGVVFVLMLVHGRHKTDPWVRTSSCCYEGSFVSGHKFKHTMFIPGRLGYSIGIVRSC